MKKNMKRSLAVLLVLLLCSGSIVCFAADMEKAYFDYDTYVLLGDSVASGHNDLTYIDSEFTRVEGSYAALVADELGAELIPMACPGFRTIEIRYMLEDDYEPDEYLFHDAHDAEVMKARIPAYRQAIAEADLITLGVGGNDFGTYLTWVISDIMAKEGICSEFVAALNEMMATAGVGTDKIEKLVDLADKMDALPDLIRILPNALAQGLATFFANWNQMIEDIYALNPDVTLLVIGMFETGVKNEEDAAASEAESTKISIDKAIVDMANSPMKAGAETYGYTFVDTTGTICDTYHPNAAGHRHIADRILEALPDANFPYADIALGSEHYNAVSYLYKNGIMDGTTATTFGPDEALTKSQLAEALYNAAGAPDVSSLTAEFADVDAADPARDAIVWADANGILTADKKGNFSPDATVSVLTFALTLFRGVTAEKMDLFRFIKAFSLLFGVLKENGFANLGADITRGAAAEKIVTYCSI